MRNGLEAGPSTVNAVEKMPWFSTMRARVGYPVGTVMPCKARLIALTA